VASELPTWIAPGDTATLVWHTGAVRGADGVQRYQVSGPVFDQPPPSPYFLLAPAAREDFAATLYRGQGTLPALREFLADCVLARGGLVDATEFVAVAAEAPVLTVLDGWRTAAASPRLPYLPDIGAFFLEGALPLHVTAEAHAAAQATPEVFQTAWVCEECGEAEDAGVFLWTAHHDGVVRVFLLIQNDAGVWSCALHPFEFAIRGEPS
jgi:hypothetical protein